MKHKKTTKKAAAPAASEPEVPTVPPIIDPPFQPSPLSTSIYDQPVVDYKKYEPSIEKEVKEDSLDSLGPFQEQPALNAARVVLEVIDNPGFDELNASTSPAVTDFLQFLRQKVPYKAMLTIATNWPVAIPKPHIQMDSFIHLLLRMAQESSEPTKFIRWVCNNFPQHKWVKKSTSTNADLMSMGLAIVEGQGEKPLWVCLDSDSVIHVYRVAGDECEPVIEAKVSRTRSGEEKKVIVDGISGEEVCRFTPIDAKLSQPWAVSFDKKRASFPMFMSSYDSVIPPLVYKAYESAFISVDGLMVRGISGRGVIADQHRLAESLLDLFQHAQCVHQLLATLVGGYLDTPQLTVESTLDDKSTLVALYKVYVERFGAQYVTEFLRKLVVYIDKSEELNIENMANVNVKKSEKVFFTVLKYILDSGSLFSSQIRHLASYLREYSTIRFNKTLFTYNMIADFIGIRFICGVLENPTKYIPDLQLQHPDNVRGICRLLRIAFKLGTMGGDYEKFSSWNTRLNKHVYPQLVQFILSIGDIAGKDIVYGIPDDEHYGQALHFLIKEIAEKHKPFMKELEVVKRASVLPGLLGYNFATALSEYFVHTYDSQGPPPERKHHHHHKKEEPEQPKEEEPKAEEPKPEEPKAEEPKPEEPKPEEPKEEEPKHEEKSEKSSSSSSSSKKKEEEKKESDNEAPPPPPPEAPPLPEDAAPPLPEDAAPPAPPEEPKAPEPPAE